jgi:hypothetical protein
MSDWIHALPLGWMALVVFGGTALGAAAIYWIVIGLATEDRVRAFKGVSPGLLPPLGIIFGLLVAFIAAQVWGDATLTMIPAGLGEALELATEFPVAGEGQAAAQREIVANLDNALDARRQRILLSRSAVDWVKWFALLFQAALTLTAIAMIHSDNRATARFAMGLFATAIAVCIFLLTAHDRLFTGQFSVRPTPLLQVRTDSAAGEKGS